MKPYTISELDRVAVCPPSAVLPRSAESTAYSSFGTVGHDLLRRAQGSDLGEAIAEAPEEFRDALRLIDLEQLRDLLAGDLAPELAVAIDIDAGTARELGRDMSRDYSGATDSELCGTMDLAGISPSAIYVGDWKLGHFPAPPPHRNRQLRGYLFAMVLIHGREKAIGEIIHAPPGREHYRARAEFEAFDLVVLFLEELREIDRRVIRAKAEIDAGRLPQVTQGEHCRLCPARYTCPAKLALAAQLAAPRSLETAADLLQLELTPATAGAARERVALVKSLLKEVERQIDDFAWSHPIPIGNGRFYGPVDKSREQLDGDKVFDAISLLFPAHAEVGNIAAPAERKGTKKGIDAALRELKERGAITSMAPVKRELLGALEAAGGVTKKTSRALGEYRAAVCRTANCGQQAMTDGGVCRDCALDLEFGGDA